ncbi:MAG: BREX-1 system adenine-specific DNA-methyltransferase PglX, partial [Acinetobacter sp.]
SFMNDWFTGWIQTNYSNEKEDLCTCFVSRGLSFIRTIGLSAMITTHSWMSLNRYKTMRQEFITNASVCNVCHLGAWAFDSISGERVQTVIATLKKLASNQVGFYCRLTDVRGEKQKSQAFLEALSNRNGSDRIFYSTTSRFFSMPDYIFAYQASNTVEAAFKNGHSLSKIGDARQGAATGDNPKFVRLWWEVANGSFISNASSLQDVRDAKSKWVPFNKGGHFRKWYGNNDCVIAFDESNYKLLLKSGNHLPSRQLYFKPSISWSKIASNQISLRYKPRGQVFSDAGMCIFASDGDLCLLQGFLNSTSVNPIASILSPTLHFEVGQVAQYPILSCASSEETVKQFVLKNRRDCQTDWDSFETSWDFKQHPFAPLQQGSASLISDGFARWSDECQQRFDTLKANEEELNRIFAEIYHMENEVPIEVPDDKVSVRRADLQRDIKSLISYGVGCLFGRYSVDKPGLILADQGSTAEDFREKLPNASFSIDEDGILPVLDGEWFADDITAQFKKWLEVVYGADTLSENIAFIEEALGKDIRTYFIKDFYNDHVKIYQKHPIYWLFSSPKKSFSALIYLHRYTPSTVGQILTGYLREYIEKLNSAITSLDASDRAADRRQADKYRIVVKELSEWER